MLKTNQMSNLMSSTGFSDFGLASVSPVEVLDLASAGVSDNSFVSGLEGVWFAAFAVPWVAEEPSELSSWEAWGF